MKGKIISVSRRTDIPAFYTPWFMNRVREGFCVYPNPLYSNKFYRVSLQKEDVLGIVFWTRHPAPLIPHLLELDKAGFSYYFQYTVVGYPRTIDLRSPSIDVAIKTFVDLSEHVGPDRVIWRYDPIILNREITASWHHDNFRRLADALARATRRVVISVVDPYLRTKRRLGNTDDGVLYAPEAYAEVLSMIVSEAKARNFVVQSCAEGSIKIDGVSPSSCVDASLLYRLRNLPVPMRIPFQKQRENCLCHKSVDIGVNDSCGFGCPYCFATTSHKKAMERVKLHRSDWSCIIGDVLIDPPERKEQQHPLFGN
jgi:hypothetical protein